MLSRPVSGTLLALALVLSTPSARAGLSFVDFSDAAQAADFTAHMAPFAGQTLDLPSLTQPGGVLPLTGGATVTFSDPDGNPNTPTVYDSDNYSWWDVPDTYFVGTSTHTIKLDFSGMNVVGIEFDLGVTWNRANAWFEAVLSDGSGATSPTYPVSNSGVSHLGTYLDNGGADACRSISSLTVEPPPNWGVGDIKVYQSPGCASVPEPGSVVLLGLGLLMFVLLRRFKGEID